MGLEIEEAGDVVGSQVAGSQVVGWRLVVGGHLAIVTRLREDRGMRPLDGITIVDLSQVVAGPFATQLLGEQGAEVIKVEPLDGEILRVGDTEGVSVNFANFNRAKRSIALDLDTAEARAIVLELCERADVMIENFRPGVMDRLGLPIASLRRANPDLVTVSITGFGPDGPHASRPALDPVIQAHIGMVDGQRSADLPFPDLVRTLVADKTTAYTAAQAITAALFARERGGGAQHLDIPMIDATIAWYWPDGMSDHTGLGGQPGGRICDLYQLTPTADGQVVFYAAKIEHLVGLLRAVGRDDLADDPDYSTRGVLVAHPERAIDIWTAIGEGVASMSTDDAVARVIEQHVPVGPVVSRAEVLDDPQLAHNGILVEWEHPVAGPLRQTGPPVRFTEMPTPLVEQVPVLGEHTDEVLAELGRTADEIAALRAARAIAPAP